MNDRRIGNRECGTALLEQQAEFGATENYAIRTLHFRLRNDFVDGCRRRSHDYALNQFLIYDLMHTFSIPTMWKQRIKIVVSQPINVEALFHCESGAEQQGALTPQVV